MRLMDDMSGVPFFFFFPFSFFGHLFRSAMRNVFLRSCCSGGDVTVTLVSIAAPHIFNVYFVIVSSPDSVVVVVVVVVA